MIRLGETLVDFFLIMQAFIYIYNSFSNVIAYF